MAHHNYPLTKVEISQKFTCVLQEIISILSAFEVQRIVHAYCVVAWWCSSDAPMQQSDIQGWRAASSILICSESDWPYFIYVNPYSLSICCSDNPVKSIMSPNGIPFFFISRATSIFPTSIPSSLPSSLANSSADCLSISIMMEFL